MLKADARYADELITARAATGLDESAVTGTMRLRGLTVAVIALDFRFLGGTVGVAAATRLTSAVRRATAGGLPLLAVTASGGTRMQEGTLAFLQMIPLTAAIVAHRTAGLPFVVYLRNPTTGGVVASWGSLGHVTAAEPAALIGFLGPKVHAALHGGRRLSRRVLPCTMQLAQHRLPRRGRGIRSPVPGRGPDREYTHCWPPANRLSTCPGLGVVIRIRVCGWRWQTSAASPRWWSDRTGHANPQ
jgi:hypothetical protein